MYFFIWFYEKKKTIKRMLLWWWKLLEEMTKCVWYQKWDKDVLLALKKQRILLRFPPFLILFLNFPLLPPPQSGRVPFMTKTFLLQIIAAPLDIISEITQTSSHVAESLTCYQRLWRQSKLTVSMETIPNPTVTAASWCRGGVCQPT